MDQSLNEVSSTWSPSKSSFNSHLGGQALWRSYLIISLISTLMPGPIVAHTTVLFILVEDETAVMISVSFSDKASGFSDCLPRTVWSRGSLFFQIDIFRICRAYSIPDAAQFCRQTCW